jgi:hypothetical protein
MEKMSQRDKDYIWRLVRRPAASVNWKAVIARARHCPDEIEVHWGSFPLETTVLHHIIPMNPPVKALKAILRAYPDALSTSCHNEDQGEEFFPLGLACKIDAPFENIRAILKGISICIQESDRFLRVALDSCELFDDIDFWYDEFPLERMQLCLEELPMGLFSTMDQDSAIAYIERVLCHMSFSRSWERLNLFMMKLTMGVTREEDLNGRRFLLLHSLLEAVRRVGPCDQLGLFDLITYAIKERSPQQFSTKDDNGALPLHIAASFENKKCFRNDRGTERSKHEFYTITALLNEYPEAASIPDGQGRLPLHIAASHGLVCSDLIAKAEPRALVTRCVATHMYPFQLAALAPDYTEEVANINNTYDMLRKAPHVLQRYRVNDAWTNSPEFMEIQQNRLKMAQLEVRNVSLKRKYFDALKSGS